MTPICEVLQPGCVPYQQAWDWQNTMAEQRGRGESPDRLLLLQHPHTYTLGTSAHEDHLLLSSDKLDERGITVFHVDRGGDITYHGPGQLVGYPIIQLPRASDTLRMDVVGYVRNIEQVIIRTLADYGVVGKPIHGLTGVWVDTPAGEAKVCAIGVRVNVRAVTKHGFALNLNTDLSYFEGIVPCGIRYKGVTSLAQLLGAPIDEMAVIQHLIHHFSSVFGYEIRTP
ncbi:MAG: lipoyl(octanoyl) transferase LipB [Anaerolineae bacterium]|nr:lipoyl(octanoyl) transferase LipB [Anaerolineae bacterium]